MRKLLGGGFFVAAGVYLVVTKPPDIITLLAVAACAVIAGLSTTKYSYWSIIGGAMLIAGSLFLQSVLSYRCMDCLKADTLILAGIISLTVLYGGKFRISLRVMASVMTAMLAINIILHTDPAETANAQRSLSINEVSRYITASIDEKNITIDTSVKPVLFYSPTCGPCTRAVEALVQADPEGRRWVPVQTGTGQNFDREYLKGKGYRGESLNAKWSGMVPALVFTREGKTMIIRDPEEILKFVRGEALYEG